MSNIKPITTIISVACPTCAAPAGVPCIGTGTPGYAHMMRLRDNMLAHVRSSSAPLPETAG